MMYLKTEDESYVKDSSSGAVLNNNAVAFQAFRRQREERKASSQLHREVDQLKADVQEIKQLLKMIAERV